MEWLLLVDVETQHTDCYHHSLDYTHHKWSITLGGVIIVCGCRDSTLVVTTTVWITHITSDPLHLVEWLLLVDVETQHTDCYHHSLDYTHHKWSITLGGLIIVCGCRDSTLTVATTVWITHITSDPLHLVEWLLLVDVETQHTDLPPLSRLHTSQVIHYTWWSDYC